MPTDSTSPKAARPAAIIYARVSSKEQERGGFSIPAQLDLIRRYAAERGFEIVREFEDIETAKRAGRTGFGEMIRHLKEHPSVRAVLVEKTDRLYRNLRDWVLLDPEDMGLELHFVKEGQVVSRASRSSEKFVHGIKVLMAKQYIDNLSEEVRKGMLRKAEEGLYPSHPPVGYRTIVAAGKKTMEPDPVMGPVVARLFERYSTGQYSISQLASLARAEGLASQFGKPVATSGVHRLLRTLTYSGRFEWTGKTYRGAYPPLVPADIFERVQVRLSRRLGNPHLHPDGSGKGVYRKHNFPLAGVVTCGHCDHALVGQIQKGRYVYYRCGCRRERHVREEILLEQFERALLDLDFGQDVLDFIEKALRESHADEEKYRDEAVARLRVHRDRIQARIDRLIDALLDGRIAEKAHDRKMEEMRAEQDRVDDEIGAHKVADRSYTDDLVALLKLARGAHFLFVRGDRDEKRRLLRFLHSNSTWADGALTVSWRSPFDSLADTHRRVLATGEAAVSINGPHPLWLGR